MCVRNSNCLCLYKKNIHVPLKAFMHSLTLVTTFQGAMKKNGQEPPWLLFLNAIFQTKQNRLRDDVEY